MHSQVHKTSPKLSIAMSQNLLPYVEVGKKSGDTLVFVSGFPDDQLSACAPLVEELKNDFRILAVCLPDFDLKGADVSKARPWGYSFAEIDSLLDATVTTVLGKDEKFTLVIHDWGSFIGTIYENKRPERVQRVVMMDVGIKKKLSPYDAIVILLYQWWFAVSYIIFQVFGSAIGNIAYYSFGVIAMCAPFLVVLTGQPIPRPSEELSVHMCYPYFQFWKSMITANSDIKMKFPTCPLLYLVSY